MTSRRIILHVGAYKTATSTLQSLFTLHRDEIATEFGIFYPNTFRRVNSGVSIAGMPGTDSFAHHMLVHFLRKDEDAAAREGRIADRFAEMAKEFGDTDCTTLFLSTELLSFCPAEYKKLIVDNLAGFDVTVVYAVRNPIDFVESMNNQILKAGERLKAGGRRGAPHPPARAVQFLRNIDEWIALCGAENVVVLPFSSAQFEPFCVAFLAVFANPGFADFARTRMPRTNSSISAQGARLRQLFNRYLPRPRDIAPRKRHQVTRLITDLDLALERRTPLVTLGSAERAEVHAINAAQMEEICRRFIPPPLHPMLAEPERGMTAEKTPLDALPDFPARDMERIIDCLSCAQRLFAETGAARRDETAST